ncbi:DNA-processing protein DprA [Solitalea sp. MAHUQ-68]|uniref:DNA-processing protein DprA n=1 Tax=Solitalea agri TaxID=2953739 RepID=A0A9X2EZH3_9SPHI|nr:DNA-processing protein DprA [Solitalea agri]MCO4291411.1 DNA-processing protein DprA [Solitalea agri]
MSLLHQIALTLVPGVGNVNGRNLLSYCGSEEEIFKSKISSLVKIPGIGNKVANAIHNASHLRRAEEELEFISKFKINTYFFTSSQYPKRLKNCDDAPILLYTKGNCDFNQQKVISIVGTRNASDYGKEFTRKFIEDLQHHNPIIVSGLAYGIDIIAHKVALKHELATIGVLAHGLDKIYPAAHRSVASKMIQNGALITEFISQSKPDRENFPKRNRIVAGMCDATVVVEAGEKGGALITADIANSYNRDVFAVPGRAFDEFSVGCNHLIKSNSAQLITSAKDFEFFMGWNSEKINRKGMRELFYDLNDEEKIVLELINSENTISIDDLLIKSRFSSSNISKILLNLEFNALVKQLPGKIYSIL